MDILLDRRSIREYTGEPVSEAQIEDLLKAAMYAPSAVNCQPWHFIAITDRKTMDDIIDIHPYTRSLKKAGAAIVVCAEPALSPIADYWQQDCAAATENILLAAKAMGLGSCWCGVAPRDERIVPLRELLGIPQDITPFCIIAVGHPGCEPPRPPDRWKPERIHRDRW